MTELGYRFIQLLRSTYCPTIIGILNPYWTTITKHRRNPNHITLPLPWSFKDIYDNPVASDVTLLTLSSSNTSSFVDPVAARGLVSQYHPTTKQHNATTTKPTSTNFRQTSNHPSTNTYALHRTKDGRQFLSLPNQSSILPQRSSPCKLCHNKPVNPWHATESCPYKHPTHIIAKDVRERVMQHNALHGVEKPGFSKTQNVPNAASSPPVATGHSAIVTSEVSDTIPTNDPSDSTNSLVDISSDSVETSLNINDEIVDTTYFDVPSPPPIVNNASTNFQHADNNGFYQDLQPNTYITDPLQYLSYSS
jgi:hypothetical protein